MGIRGLYFIVIVSLSALLIAPFVAGNELIPVLHGKAKYACTTVTDERGVAWLTCQIKIPIDVKFVEQEPLRKMKQNNLAKETSF